MLVTGGFHSAGLHALFKNNNIAYVEVSPAISHVTENTAYQDVMTLEGDYLKLRSHVKPDGPVNPLIGQPDRQIASQMATLITRDALEIWQQETREAIRFSESYGNAAHQIRVEVLPNGFQALFLSNKPVSIANRGVVAITATGRLDTLPEADTQKLLSVSSRSDGPMSTPAVNKRAMQTRAEARVNVNLLADTKGLEELLRELNEQGVLKLNALGREQLAGWILKARNELDSLGPSPDEFAKQMREWAHSKHWGSMHGIPPIFANGTLEVIAKYLDFSEPSLETTGSSESAAVLSPGPVGIGQGPEEISGQTLQSKPTVMVTVRGRWRTVLALLMFAGTVVMPLIYSQVKTSRHVTTLRESQNNLQQAVSELAMRNEEMTERLDAAFKMIEEQQAGLKKAETAANRIAKLEQELDRLGREIRELRDKGERMGLRLGTLDAIMSQVGMIDRVRALSEPNKENLTAVIQTLAALGTVPEDLRDPIVSVLSSTIRHLIEKFETAAANDQDTSEIVLAVSVLAIAMSFMGEDAFPALEKWWGEDNLNLLTVGLVILENSSDPQAAQGLLEMFKRKIEFLQAIEEDEVVWPVVFRKGGAEDVTPHLKSRSEVRGEETQQAKSNFSRRSFFRRLIVGVLTLPLARPLWPVTGAAITGGTALVFDYLRSPEGQSVWSMFARNRFFWRVRRTSLVEISSNIRMIQQGVEDVKVVEVSPYSLAITGRRVKDASKAFLEVEIPVNLTAMDFSGVGGSLNVFDRNKIQAGATWNYWIRVGYDDYTDVPWARSREEDEFVYRSNWSNRYQNIENLLINGASLVRNRILVHREQYHKNLTRSNGFEYKAVRIPLDSGQPVTIRVRLEPDREGNFQFSPGPLSLCGVYGYENILFPSLAGALIGLLWGIGDYWRLLKILGRNSIVRWRKAAFKLQTEIHTQATPKEVLSRRALFITAGLSIVGATVLIGYRMTKKNPSSEVEARLRLLYEHTDPRVRIQAVSELSELLEAKDLEPNVFKRAIVALAAGLTFSDSDVARACLEALLTLRPKSFTVLYEAFTAYKDGVSSDEAKILANAMARIATREDVSSIFRAWDCTGDFSSWFVGTHIILVKGLYELALEAKQKADVDTEVRIINGFIEYALTSEIPEISQLIIQYLGDLEARQAVEKLISILNRDEDVFYFSRGFVLEAIRSLGRIKDSRARAPLEAKLNTIIKDARNFEDLQLYGIPKDMIVDRLDGFVQKRDPALLKIEWEGTEVEIADVEIISAILEALKELETPGKPRSEVRQKPATHGSMSTPAVNKRAMQTRAEVRNVDRRKLAIEAELGKLGYGSSLNAMAAVYEEVSRQTASPFLPREILEMFLNLHSQRLAEHEALSIEEARARIRSIFKKALGDYAWLIPSDEVTEPIDLTIPVPEGAVAKDYLSLLSGLGTNKDRFCLVLSGKQVDAVGIFRQQLVKSAKRLGNNKMAEPITILNGGNSEAEMIRAIQRRVGLSSDRILSGVLHTDAEFLRKLGYRGAARILGPADLKNYVAATLAAALLRHQVPDRFGINHLEQWMKEHHIQADELFMRIERALDEIRAISKAA
ncbi:MAG: hypothetical protein NC930_03505 [Candidatus Omnitrophica bacterium]|nr:hypothetical protein [Candidatus Omnitrophota bacterium]